MSQTFQVGQLDQHLDIINNQSSAILNDALATTMNDPGAFITFAGYGRYSGAVSNFRRQSFYLWRSQANECFYADESLHTR